MRREKIAETGKSGAAAGPQITRILEPGTTAFSAAEIRVVSLSSTLHETRWHGTFRAETPL